MHWNEAIQIWDECNKRCILSIHSLLDEAFEILYICHARHKSYIIPSLVTQKSLAATCYISAMADLAKLSCSGQEGFVQRSVLTITVVTMMVWFGLALFGGSAKLITSIPFGDHDPLWTCQTLRQSHSKTYLQLDTFSFMRVFLFIFSEMAGSQFKAKHIWKKTIYTIHFCLYFIPYSLYKNRSHIFRALCELPSDW